MADKISWGPILAGVGVGVVGALVYANYAQAASTPAAAGTTYSLNITPGAQTATFPRSSTIVLALPNGANWATTGTPVNGLPITVTQPTGNQTFNITASANPGNMAPLTLSWTDSGGTAQTTNLQITLT